MLNNLKQRKSEGFTIIEVMIVLAIAGLILLIVFLAVPALQRNAHNTSIKNDVASALGAVNEYVNNNNGTLPTTVGISAGVLTASGAAGTNSAKVNVGYIDTASWATDTSTAVPTTVGTIVIVKGIGCNSTGTGSSTSGVSSRSYAALFSLEGGAKQCQAS